MNRDAFFALVRRAPFGSLSQPQVDGLNAILDEWDRQQPKLGAFNKVPDDIRWLAYMLATTFHETGTKMQPIDEDGGPKYFSKYDGREDLGNTLPGDGARFHGRGFVQLTGRRNYSKASDRFSVDMVASPELAKRLDLAAKIMFSGMTEGWFTGKKFSDYINKGFCDYTGARRIINGTDRAVTIAGYAVQFERALKTAAETQPATHDTPIIDPGPTPVIVPILRPPPPDVPAPEPAPPSDEGFFVRLIRSIADALFSKGN